MSEEKNNQVQQEIDLLVEKGLKALDEFRLLNQEQVDYIVAKASVAALDQHGVLAQHAIEETGRGVFEDKATKNLFACEHVVHNMRHTKTVGVISDDEIIKILNDKKIYFAEENNEFDEEIQRMQVKGVTRLINNVFMNIK